MTEDEEFGSLQEIPITKGENGQWYTREFKIEAAAAFLSYGEEKPVLALFNIPQQTFNLWTKQPWWEICIEIARFRQGQLLDSRLSKIIELSTAAVIDRLENGEEVLMKDGSREMVQVKARDAMLMAAIATDKRQLIRGQPTSIRRDENLGNLAKKLQQIGASGKKGALIEQEPDPA
jgi:hypothetical protein